jgi:Zn-dependent peptidase ImmA (M78 family)
VSLRSLSHRLRKRFPNVRVTVRTVAQLHGAFATTEKDGSQYLIKIDRNLRQDFAAFILAHEFAHAVSWRDTKDDDHGPAFWKAYMDCFDVYVAWCRE